MTKKLAVILVNFASNPVQPYTKSYANGVIFGNTYSVAAFYDEESYGRIALTGDVSGWFTISYDTRTCDTAAIQAKADAAATAAGVDLANYTNISYVFPHLSACSFAGRAQLPGKRSWINTISTTNPKIHDWVVAHEPATLRRPPRQQLHVHDGRCSGDPLGQWRGLRHERVRRPPHGHGRLEPDREVPPQPRLAPSPDGLHGRNGTA